MTRLRTLVGCILLSTAITSTYALRVLGLFTSSAEMWIRPMLVAVLAGCAIGLFCGLLIRRRTRAHVASGLAAAAAISTLWVVAAVLLVVAYFIVSELLRRRNRQIIAAADAVAGIRAFLIATALVTAAGLVLGGVAVPTNAHSARTDGISNSSPNIYLVLLDAYARADTLNEVFGTDISQFAAGLKSIGFDVYDRSTSNYNATELTLLSMLDGTYVDELPSLLPVPTDSAGQARAIARALTHATLIDGLRRHGYEIVTIPPPVVHVRIYGADRTIEAPGLTDLEVFLYFTSNLGRATALAFPDFVLDDQRNHVLASLDAFVAAAEPSSKQLVLTHLMVPHPPFLWGSAGQRRQAPGCFPDCNLWEGDTYRVEANIADFANQFADQVRYINGPILQAIHDAVAADPNGIFIVFGDHGSRLDKTDRREAFRNFFAARTPGHPQLFGDAPSLINTLPTVERAYLGEDTADLPSRYFFVPDLRHLLRFSQVSAP